MKTFYDKNSRFQKEVEEFKKAFAAFSEKKVVIYGTGRMTATLLQSLKGFDIVGLCDREESMIGSIVYGKPILSRKEAEMQGDILVINTDATYWNAIYKRIKCWDIPIYYRNGEKATISEKIYMENPYWDNSIDLLKKRILEHDVVSFDIFDTLLVRKVAVPSDVYRIIDRNLRNKWKNLDYIKARKKAASVIENATIDEIYHEIEKREDWTKEQVVFAKRLEMQVEKSLIAGRMVLCDLCREMMESKEVYFVTDMYFGTDFLQELLLQAGIDVDKEQIIVSCEHRKTKKDGQLWEWYKKNIVKSRSAIHVGDNLQSDIEMPCKYKIETFYVMSVMSMLEHSSMNKIMPEIISLQSSIAIGVLIARMFNNPFELCLKKGIITFKDAFEAGYVLLGNYMYNYFLWLIEQANKDRIDEILFFAREGYLLMPIYDHFCEKIGRVCPSGKYLEISRRAIWGVTVKELEDIYVIGEFPYSGNVKNYLKDRFGIEQANTEFIEMEMSEIQHDEKTYRKVIETVEKDIYERLTKDRTNYLRYLDTLQIKGKTAIVDSFVYGSTQYFFQKVIKEPLKGYYFCVIQNDTNPYYTGDNMIACFQKMEDPEGKDCATLGYSKFLEAFFTAPHGMLEYVDSEGNFHYTSDMLNQKFFEIRYDMLRGILSYLDEIMDMQKAIGIEEYMLDVVFADKLYGVLMNEGFEPSEQMKNSFYFDNRILNNKEAKIWD